MKDFRVNQQVLTPYGLGTVVEINPSYGCRVRTRSGGTEWHAFIYLTVARIG